MRAAWLTSSLVALGLSATASADEWSFYGRDAQGTRFSPLASINALNVAQLRPAWTFHTGDIADGKHGTRRSGFESTPLFIDGRLYLTTPFNRMIALDASSGRQLWSFDPNIDKTAPYGDGLINRGLAAWRDAGSTQCALRLFEATLDARLVAIDGRTGKRCSDFGKNGEISLRDVPNYTRGWYHMTSPPIVVDGVVIVGSAIDDNGRVDMPDGMVRGYDARTGALLWKWEPLERPPGTPSDRWQTGAGNAWSILSADPVRHLVYVPTGSPSPDYFGGLRPGDNRWANSVVALNPKTGKLAWGFQLVHHDLWDYDTTAAPLVTSFTLNGKPTSALIAGNKSGLLYVLDPSTGSPVVPIEERAVPHGNTPGETTSPTQPFSTTLPLLAPDKLTPGTAWGLTEADRAACDAELRKLTGTSLFTPPSTESSLAVPGIIGGINWSGFAWDATHERLIVAVTNFAYKIRLIPADKFGTADRGDLRSETSPQKGAPYGLTRGPLRAPSGVPCTPPPWGELMAVDLAAGRIAWRTAVGSLEEVVSGIGKSAPGSVILGGPIVTAGGVIFIGGSVDRQFRAFSAETGKELWAAQVPASAHATPITYEIGGRQFVVIAAGGSAKIDEELQGDAVVAFTLP